MNIFYINSNPIIAAQQLADDHIRKMQIEAAQMLCFAHYVYGILTPPYKNSKQHFNHPCSKWVRQSIQHYDWLLIHGIEVCNEFEKRYNHPHKTKQALEWLQQNKPPLPNIEFIEPPKCMPDEFIAGDTIQSYHNYYINDKIKIKGLNWNKLNNQPKWSLPI